MYLLQPGAHLLLLQAEAAVEPEAPIKPSEEDLWYRKMAKPMYFQVGMPPAEPSRMKSPAFGIVY